MHLMSECLLNPQVRDYHAGVMAWVQQNGWHNKDRTHVGKHDVAYGAVTL